MLYACHHKKALLFEPRAPEFLNAYTSNTLERPGNAFVDVHGRIVATADQHVLSGGKVLMVIEARFEERLRRHLEKYAAFFGTRIGETAYRVYFDLDSSARPAATDIVIPQKAGRLILSPNDLPAPVAEEEFRLFRVQNGIPLQGVDYDQDILLNVADEEYVSYEKGCYLGQEVIARIHFRGKPSKKLAVISEAECSIADRDRLSSKTWDPRQGKFFGFLFLQNHEP